MWAGLGWARGWPVAAMWPLGRVPGCSPAWQPAWPRARPAWLRRLARASAASPPRCPAARQPAWPARVCLPAPPRRRDRTRLPSAAPLSRALPCHRLSTPFHHVMKTCGRFLPCGEKFSTPDEKLSITCVCIGESTRNNTRESRNLSPQDGQSFMICRILHNLSFPCHLSFRMICHIFFRMICHIPLATVFVSSDDTSCEWGNVTNHPEGCHKIRHENPMLKLTPQGTRPYNRRA